MYFLSLILMMVFMHSAYSSEVLRLKDAKVFVGKDSEAKVINQQEVKILKGFIHIKSKGKINVVSSDVSFSTESAEFEVSLSDNKDVDLDVVRGEVLVSSPHVHTFVPEIVKAQEGFRYRSNPPGFERRKYSIKIKYLE